MMKLPYRESFAYYASCMILFNIIFLLKNLMQGLFCPSNIDLTSCKYLLDVLTFGLASAFLLIGVVVTFFICCSDDCVIDKNTAGKKVSVEKIKDDTSDNFFSKFSLLVLTGLSLPVCSGIFSLIIYLLVVLSIGIVYTDKNLIYINPLLALFRYNIYTCDCVLEENKEKKQYCFFKRGKPPKLNSPFCFQNMAESKRIIRLKKEIKYCLTD